MICKQIDTHAVLINMYTVLIDTHAVLIDMYTVLIDMYTVLIDMYTVLIKVSYSYKEHSYINIVWLTGGGDGDV